MASTVRDPSNTAGDNRSIIESSSEESLQQISINENISDKCLLKCKILTTGEKDQYIKLRSPSAGGLPYSAKFRCGSAHWKLHGAQCLVTIGSSYVAQVSVEASEDLNSASDFEKAKELLLQLVLTVKVLEDQLLLKTTSLRSSIQMELTKLASNCGQCIESGKFLFEIRRLAEKHSYDVGTEFCKEMSSNRFVSSKTLKVSIVMFTALRSSLQSRYAFLKEDKWSHLLHMEKRLLEDFFNTVATDHKNLLLEVCSLQMKPELKNIESYRCLLLRTADVTIFKDLEGIMVGEMPQQALVIISKNFIQRIATVDCSQALPVTNEIFCCVCKSLMDIANRVQEKLGIQNSIQYDGRQWKMATIAKNSLKSGLDRCLVSQMHMLVNFANHYEPGKPTVNENYPYDYQIECFKSFALTRNEENTWACLMDAVMVNVFQKDFTRIGNMSAMFQAFLEFISSADQQKTSSESMRMVTHIILEYVAAVERIELYLDEIGKQIFKKQIGYIAQAIQASHTDCTRLKHVTSAFKDCWIWSKCGFPKLMDTLYGKYLSPHVKELRSKLLQIVTQALDKNVSLDEITKFFETFNVFCMDLEALGFEWYVRVHNDKIRKTLLDMKAINCVHNSLFTTDDKCFLVSKDKYDMFIQICANEVIPKHYQVEIVKTLLDHVLCILDKRSWNDGTCLTGEDQLNAAMSLINSIRTSLLYLKEQPEYANFTQFYKRSTKPFKTIIKECSSITNFTQRMEFMMQSFPYIRNQQVLDVDKALTIFSTLNAKCDEQLLMNAFQLYVGQFEKHMRECDDLEYADKIKRIVRHVSDKVKPIRASKWTAGFKQNTIPLILAGVRAVWAILTSEDVLNPGKLVKPHSLQILTVLRFLCVDNDKSGVDKHLAQIMTAQGESVVLGLIAAVLALFGHKVEIVCHSEHLAKHDAADFCDLYEALSIQPKISYKTIDDVVNERLRTFSEKAWIYLSKCLGIPPELPNKNVPVDADLSDTVLLMNEFDVFVEKYYGDTSYNVFAPEVKGLGQIQHKIWDLVQSNTVDIERQLEAFLQSSSDPDVVQLKSLIERPGSYKLVTINHDETLKVLYNNKTFFTEKFNQMVKTAKEVHRLHIDECAQNFKLDCNGVITCRNENGEFLPNLYCQYLNAFMYFKLQKDNFVQSVNGSVNFGYLPLDFSSFSYAKLPDQYSLFLCVTGTFRGFKLMQQKTIMPPFFGATKLKFSQQENFQCLPELSEWKAAIFDRVNAVINENRSVIVFFSNKFEIEQFRLSFESQIVRLNEVTVETDDDSRERYIIEAGVPRTVTLATRDMGLGLDYKTTLSVEKNGGIHVIQTFFSLEENEETLIKRCTARKGNKGSYEVIVSLPHLVTLDVVDRNEQCRTISYAQLEKSRRNLSKRVDEDKTLSIKRANQNHEMLVKFYESV